MAFSCRPGKWLQLTVAWLMWMFMLISKVGKQHAYCWGRETCGRLAVSNFTNNQLRETWFSKRESWSGASSPLLLGKQREGASRSSWSYFRAPWEENYAQKDLALRDESCVWIFKELCLQGMKLHWIVCILKYNVGKMATFKDHFNILGLAFWTKG